MLEMDSAMSDRYDIKQTTNKEKLRNEDEKLDKLNALGLNITKK